MSNIIIIPPNITKEENEKVLARINEIINRIANQSIVEDEKLDRTCIEGKYRRNLT